MTEKKTLSIPEAAIALGISETAAWGAVSRGLLRSFKIGRRRLTTPEAVNELIQQREREAAELIAR